MDFTRPLLRLCVVLACLGIPLQSTTAHGARPDVGQSNHDSDSRFVGIVGDVELDANGSLHGVVINLQGVPVAHAEVVVRYADREAARTSTDALGCFLIEGLRGGTYLVTVGNSTRLYRTWVARTAPPKTSRLALVIVGGDLVRGQAPFGSFFASDAFIVTGMVGAMIAIPIAIDTPSSP